MTKLPNQTLLKLGAMVARHQVTCSMGELHEIQTSRAVIAGTVATLRDILPAKQFRQVLIQWEIDEAQLADLLETAGPVEEEAQTTDTTIDV
jgi:hypothetical protein